MANQKAGVFTINGKSEQRGCRKNDIMNFYEKRLKPSIVEHSAKKRKFGKITKEMWKETSKELAENDISKIDININYKAICISDRDFIDSDLRGAVNIIRKFCNTRGIINMEDLLEILSLEELWRGLYGMGVIKLTALGVYLTLMDIPFYLTEEDRLEKKLFIYKPTRGRKPKQGDDK